MANPPYASAVGSLIYVTMCTQPDICFAVGMVRRYQSNLEIAYWDAIKNMLQYLRRTTNLALCYQGESPKLVRYGDTNHADDKGDQKSTSEYVFILERRAIS